MRSEKMIESIIGVCISYTVLENECEDRDTVRCGYGFIFHVSSVGASAASSELDQASLALE